MKNLAYLLLFALFTSCALKLKQHTFPSPVDTSSRPVTFQKKQTFTIDGVNATNDFPAARLNNFTRLDDTTYLATILPENEPINPSPWYAFKLWSERSQTIYVKLNYPGFKHRYDPKLSKDGDYWQALDSTRITYEEGKQTATLKLDIGKQALWVSAQEIQDHRRVGEWVNQLAEHRAVSAGSAGSSPQGRALYYLNLGWRENLKKPTVVIISRQHPPEVTGYLAMKSFVETILEKGTDNGFLTKFRVMVYPL